MANYRVDSKEIKRNMTRLANIVAREDPTTNEKVVYIPGLTTTDFTRTGVPTAQSVCLLVEYMRLISMKTDGSFLFLTKYGEDFLGGTQVVVLAQSINVTKYYHQRARVVFPMVLRSHLSHVGRTSYTVDATLREESSGDLLISCRRTFAVMDRASEKSMPIPDETRELMENILTKSMNIRKVEILKEFPYRPTSCFRMFLHVRHSDTDMLYHANQSTYIKYLMDAATEGVKQGLFKNFTGDLLAYRIKSLDCRYKGEALAGDALEVIVWEDARNGDRLFCQIEKLGTEIWMGSITFYPNIDNVFQARL